MHPAFAFVHGTIVNGQRAACSLRRFADTNASVEAPPLQSSQSSQRCPCVIDFQAAKMWSAMHRG